MTRSSTTQYALGSNRRAQTVRFGDPIIRFEEMIARTAVTLERRSDEELLANGRDLADPALREHALY